jgi:hypothetical protein
VFAMYGRICYLHLRENPKSKHPALAAAHVVKRSRMGSPLAFGPKNGGIEPRLGRPLCAEHHARQELGLEIDDRFSYADVLEVTLLHNSYSKVPLPLPDRKDHP